MIASSSPKVNSYYNSTMGNRLGLPHVPRKEWPSDRTYMNDTSSASNKDIHEYVLTTDYHTRVEKKGLFSSLASIIWSEPSPPLEIKESTARYAETFSVLRKLLEKNLAYVEYKSTHPSDEPYLCKIAQLANLNEGVFATEFIPKGTLICRVDQSDTVMSTQFDKKINDLAYYDFMPNYEYLDIENIKKHINVRGIKVDKIQHIQAIKDIQKGEEISRLYGYDYWFNEMDEIHNWNVPVGLEQKSATDKDRTKLENQLKLAMKARSKSVDETPTAVILSDVNLAIDDAFLDRTKSGTLKKIVLFISKQADNMSHHELEHQVEKMLKYSDSDW